jgi:hypothetical protein
LLNEDAFHHSCLKSVRDVAMTYSTISRTTRFFFSRGGIQYRSNRMGSPSLFSDDLANINLGNFELQHTGVVPIDGFNRDLFRVVYQRLGDTKYQFLHCLSSGKGSNLDLKIKALAALSIVGVLQYCFLPLALAKPLS